VFLGVGLICHSAAGYFMLDPHPRRT